MATALNAQEQKTDKLAIYQAFTRVFANTNTNNKFNGSLSENGTSKFKDINNNALKSLKKMGISHVWYTGVIEHATMTGFEKDKIKSDHPQVVKGIAGSPYAIKDYYDVNPYLATNINKRLEEFDALIARTHANGLKVIIDFVPNHVARQYKSDKKPKGVSDFGEKDDKNISFNPKNNFYYLPNQTLELDSSISPPVSYDEAFREFPAKVSGNDVFNAKPNINDWYETVKLNYGVDYQNNRKNNFSPIPDTWLKMKHILTYWAKKGVDGFRCDMAEMVPVEFWAYVIPEIKKVNKNVIFIAEIYNPKEYKNYIFTGKFDYLYDKVGLYDALRRLIEGHGDVHDITRVWQEESGDFSNKMLRFLENHDEQRVTAEEFGKNPQSALTAFMLSATLHDGPIMLYYGQELGVKPTQAEGFQGNDGRTTIFDYWGLPELQSWINNGKFDEIKLSSEQRTLRDFYAKTLIFSQQNEAVSKGEFHDLQYLNNNGQSAGYNPNKHYSYLRFTNNQVLLFVYNFDKMNTADIEVNLPQTVLKSLLKGKDTFALNSLFNEKKSTKITIGQKIKVVLGKNDFKIFEIK